MIAEELGEVLYEQGFSQWIYPAYVQQNIPFNTFMDRYIQPYLERHQRRDYGLVDHNRTMMNNKAWGTGYPVISVYEVQPGVRVAITTESIYPRNVIKTFVMLEYELATFISHDNN